MCILHLSPLIRRPKCNIYKSVQLSSSNLTYLSSSPTSTHPRSCLSLGRDRRRPPPRDCRRRFGLIRRDPSRSPPRAGRRAPPGRKTGEGCSRI
ncbi:hypothetical protein BRADI_1g27843v3 [Brachypodium distachyon]|uniref:Uncharacterized protein n=1 Tax=Brachypodium distachyon TaxID=15368 RepID=A0A2K2DLH6_BRADI|nr:hypothetical protein BRADI_1g27843v3 [Brachypodium distachyon]